MSGAWKLAKTGPSISLLEPIRTHKNYFSIYIATYSTCFSSGSLSATTTRPIKSSFPFISFSIIVFYSYISNSTTVKSNINFTNSYRRVKLFRKKEKEGKRRGKQLSRAVRSLSRWSWDHTTKTWTPANPEFALLDGDNIRNLHPETSDEKVVSESNMLGHEVINVTNMRRYKGTKLPLNLVELVKKSNNLKIASLKYLTSCQYSHF